LCRNTLKQKENQAVAHTNTVFRQLLQLVNRHEFKSLERKPEFELGRKPRKLTRWAQFAAMMFAQLSARSSLRDISDQMKAHASHLYHLGVRTVCRSTLADANQSRQAEFFETLFERQYERCRAVAPKNRFEFKNKLYSFDSTVIDLCLKAFPWAKFRSTKGGIKLHTLLDHDGYIPSFVQVTDAKVSDTAATAKLLGLPACSMVVMDRGYLDFSLFRDLAQNGIFFVTRLKKGIRYKVTERREVEKAKGLTSDQTIILTGPKAVDCPIPLRRVGYKDPETGCSYFFLTNAFHLDAKTVADLYKERWQVELFFKWIKQNLKIKTFFGTGRNAVLTQIWIALIALLLLAYCKFVSKLGIPLSKILKRLQLTLFSRRNLWELLDVSISEHNGQGPVQLSFNFS
jgi:hypothetical protein